MIKNFLCLAIIVILTLVNGESIALSQSSKRASKNKIHLVLKQLISEYNIPGAVLSYGFYNQPLHTVSAGHMNVTEKIKMQNSTYLRSGSTAKSMTSVVILDLL